jgi:translocation and assembly module TamB
MVYALPPKNFDLVNSEGVVEFVNFFEEDSVQEIGFQQYIGDTIFSKFNWIDLNALLTIDRGAQFMIDMDPVSGDYIQFGGTGNLNFVVQRNQLPQVSGTYTFDRGVYEVSYYGLVKKAFRFQPGSRITWSGDPFSALLSLKANYSIRTASIGLLSREIYGLSDEEKSQYRRALPFRKRKKVPFHL